MFGLELIIPHYWKHNPTVYSTRVFVNHEVFLSGWWKQPLLPALMCLGTFISTLFARDPVVSSLACTEYLKGVLHIFQKFSFCTVCSSPVLSPANSSHFDLSGLSSFSSGSPQGSTWIPPPCSAPWKSSR